MNHRDALRHIEKAGALLVYPLANKKEPNSLWHCFFPNSQMKWEWDVDGDKRVANLWHLREELSRSSEVVYAKWFRGRATFFSKDVAIALLAYLESDAFSSHGLRGYSADIYERLLETSPLSTKAIKKEFRDRLRSQAFDKAQRPLWERILIVGRGEVDDGAFPSLSIGVTSSLHEGVWKEGKKLSADKGFKHLEARLGKSPFLDFARRLKIKGKPLIKKKNLGTIRGEELSVYSASPALLKPR